MLAPICLFTYNRLEQTRQTILALQKNFLAIESDLYIFSDGGKNVDIWAQVSLVRDYLKTINGFKSVTIYESEINKGLANSIIGGVTKIIELHGKVIVMEDDLITSNNFLDFMNQSLDFYQTNQNIFAISGFSYSLQYAKEFIQDVSFGYRSYSWGWASWQDRWAKIDWNVTDYPLFKKSRKLQKAFNRGGSDLSSMLRKQMEGKIDSWMIRWVYHQFKHDLYDVFPKVSKVINNGFTRTATHTSSCSPLRYLTLLDSSGLRWFHLSENVEINQQIISQVRAKISLPRRIKFRLLDLLKISNKLMRFNKHYLANVPVLDKILNYDSDNNNSVIQSKAVHICISAPYIDGFSYQENILTDYFVFHGYDTTVIGTSFFPTYSNKKRTQSGEYFENKKRIIRLKSLKISNQFLIPFGLYNHLINLNPQLIFHHNLNCTSLLICVFYKILHPNVNLFVDNHSDYINNSQNKFWQFVYYKTLIMLSAKISYPFVTKFYGVTNSRCDYLNSVYGVKKDKISFLPIGADLRTANSIKSDKFALRNKYGFQDGDFIYISGGKMGVDKGTDVLIESLAEIFKSQPYIKLILFGSFNDSFTKTNALNYEFIKVYDWCDHVKSLELLKISDVAVWPLHHTTLIEDAIAVNTVLLLKKTDTTNHLIKGNGLFLNTFDSKELTQKLTMMIDFSKLTETKEACISISEELSYDLLLNKIVDDCNF